MCVCSLLLFCGRAYVIHLTWLLAAQVFHNTPWDMLTETAVIDFGRFTSCSRAYLPAEGAYVVGQRSILPARLRVRQYRRDELSGNEQGE